MCKDILDIKKISSGILLRMDELSITPGELAIESGCTESTISRYINRRTPNPRLSEIIKISNALDVTIDWLCFGDHQIEDAAKIREELLDEMNDQYNIAVVQLKNEELAFLAQALQLVVDASIRNEQALESIKKFKRKGIYSS